MHYDDKFRKFLPIHETFERKFRLFIKIFHFRLHISTEQFTFAPNKQKNYETFCLYILVVAPVTTHMKS